MILSTSLQYLVHKEKWRPTVEMAQLFCTLALLSCTLAWPTCEQILTHTLHIYISNLNTHSHVTSTNKLAHLHFKFTIAIFHGTTPCTIDSLHVKCTFQICLTNIHCILTLTLMHKIAHMYFSLSCITYNLIT